MAPPERKGYIFRKVKSTACASRCAGGGVEDLGASMQPLFPYALNAFGPFPRTGSPFGLEAYAAMVIRAIGGVVFGVLVDADIPELEHHRVIEDVEGAVRPAQDQFVAQPPVFPFEPLEMVGLEV
jgi:hypothetical protein